MSSSFEASFNLFPRSVCSGQSQPLGASNCRMVQSFGVAWHPVLPNYLASFAAQLHTIQLGHQEDEMTTFDSPNIIALDWQHSSEPVLSVATSNGQVSVLHTANLSETILSTKRTCNAVAWNPEERSQLVIGLEALKGSDSSLLLYDVEAMRTLRLPVAETCSSLCWQSAHSLLLGTALGGIRLHDLRLPHVSLASSTGMVIPAHSAARPRRLKGLRLSALTPSHLLSFSDAPADVLKLWDLRTFSNQSASRSVPLMNINPYSVSNSNNATSATAGGNNSSGGISDAAWSPSNRHLLAVATTSSSTLYCYSVATTQTSAEPVYLVSGGQQGSGEEVVRGISWQSSDRLSARYRALFDSRETARETARETVVDFVSDVVVRGEDCVVDRLRWEVETGTGTGTGTQRSCRRCTIPVSSTSTLRPVTRRGCTAQFLAIVTTEGVRLAPPPGLSLSTALSHALTSSFPAGDALLSPPPPVSLAFSSCPSSSPHSSPLSLSLSCLGDLLRPAHLGAYLVHSPEEVMRDRAVSGYSVKDLAVNLDLFLEECTMVNTARTKRLSLLLSSAQQQQLQPQLQPVAPLSLEEDREVQELTEALHRITDVHRVWFWVQRLSLSTSSTSVVMSNSNNTTQAMNPATQMTLLRLGVLGFWEQQLVRVRGVSSSSKEVETTLTLWGVAPVYQSRSRSLLLSLLCPQLPTSTSTSSSTANPVLGSFPVDCLHALRLLWGGNLDVAFQFLQQHAPGQHATSSSSTSYATGSGTSSGVSSQSFQRDSSGNLRRSILSSSAPSSLPSVSSTSSSLSLSLSLSSSLSVSIERDFCQCVSLSLSVIAGYRPGDPHWVTPCDQILDRWAVWVQSLPAAVSPLLTTTLIAWQRTFHFFLHFLRLWCLPLPSMPPADPPADPAPHPPHPLLSYLHSLLSADICLADRLSLSLRYLDAQTLVVWVEQEVETALHTTSGVHGVLEALSLVGLDSTEGVLLLQHYLDTTSDVQTVALLAAQSLCLPRPRLSSVTLSQSPLSLLLSSSLCPTLSLSPSLTLSLQHRMTLSLSSISQLSRWVALYRHSLSSWSLHSHRVALDESLNTQRLSFPALFFTTYQNYGTERDSRGDRDRDRERDRERERGSSTPSGRRGERGDRDRERNSIGGGNKTGAAGAGGAVDSRSDSSASNNSSDVAEVFRTLESLPRHDAVLRRHLAPSALRLRCGFCAAAHPPVHQLVELWKQKQREIGRLKNEKKVLQFCVQCPRRQHLPRCYVCRAFVGMLNPYRLVEALTEQGKMQIDQQAQAQRSRYQQSQQQHLSHDSSTSASVGSATAPHSLSHTTSSLGHAASVPLSTASSASSSASSTTISSTASSAIYTDKSYTDLAMPFDDWLVFCQRCRHGGHSACLRRWFAPPVASIDDSVVHEGAGEVDGAMNGGLPSVAPLLLGREESRLSTTVTDQGPDNSAGDNDEEDEEEEDETGVDWEGGIRGERVVICGVNGCDCRCDLFGD